MILKTSVWFESSNFSNPEVEKEVLQDLLRVAILSLNKLTRGQLKEIGINYSKDLERLTNHLKELEAKTITHKRVLEKMRTGLDDKKS